MEKIVLSENEVCELKSIVKNVASYYSSVEDPYFLNEACIIAHEIPKRIRTFLNNFRLLEPSSGICLISGYPISEQKIGKTPSHWQYKTEVSPTLEEEIIFILFSSLLGEVIGWSTQQAGHIIHDVIPIKGDEFKQISTASEELITWHNEDAFHPYKGDYLGLMCMRNQERAATTFASIDMVQLEPQQVKTLFEPRFIIRPDKSHLEENQSKLQARQKNSNGLLNSAYQKINEINKNPQKMPVLYGNPKSPYICIDPYFMDELKDDRQAQETLDILVQAIEAKLTEVILQPGDFLFIDNFKAVHGRKPFRARYDGKDRWLKRIVITRDLRKSRSARTSCTSRIIF